MKRISHILALCIAFIPASVLADTPWTVTEAVNILSIRGFCEDEVGIALFSDAKRDPVYTSAAHCVDGTFTFSDDLLVWDGIKDGSYRLSIGGERIQGTTVIVRRPEETPAEEISPDPSGTDVVIVEADDLTDLQPGFLGAFVALQQSLADMRAHLADSGYSLTVRIGLDAAIDGIDLIAGKMSDMLFAADDGETVTNEPESVSVGSETEDEVADRADSSADSAVVSDRSGIDTETSDRFPSDE